MLGVWRVFQGFLTVTARPLACLHRDRLAGLHGGQINRPAGFHGLVVPSGKPERDRVPPLIDVFIDVLNLFGDLWSGIERRKQDLLSRLKTVPVGLGRSWHWALACSGSVGIGFGAANRGPIRTPGSETRGIVKSADISPFRSRGAGGTAKAHDIP
jgi:hypothetical protein